MAKKLVSSLNCGPLGPNSGHQFFLKNLVLSVTTYHGQKKTNDLILRELSDEQTDGQTDRRTRVIS